MICLAFESDMLFTEHVFFSRKSIGMMHETPYVLGMSYLHEMIFAAKILLEDRAKSHAYNYLDEISNFLLLFSTWHEKFCSPKFHANDL